MASCYCLQITRLLFYVGYFPNQKKASKQEVEFWRVSSVRSTREVKQNLLSNVPAADSHPNYFGISLSYWINLILTGCATSCLTSLLISWWLVLKPLVLDTTTCTTFYVVSSLLKGFITKLEKEVGRDDWSAQINKNLTLYLFIKFIYIFTKNYTRRKMTFDYTMHLEYKKKKL